MVVSSNSILTSILFSFLLTLVLTSAQFPVPIGQCPTKTPFELIDLNQLTGQWYEIEGSPNFMEYPLKCISLQVTPFYERKSDISLSAKDRISGATINYNITATIPETSNEKDGKLTAAIAMANVNDSSNSDVIYGRQLRERYQKLHIQVLATDYDNWSLMWMCNSNENKTAHTELLWVLSREQRLNANQYRKVQDAKQANHVDWMKSRDIIQCSSNSDDLQVDESDKDNNSMDSAEDN